jgi:hypothetical protein
VQLIELKEATPFTIFVPTVEAVANLVKLFAADGCDAISKDVLSQVRTQAGLTWVVTKNHPKHRVHTFAPNFMDCTAQIRRTR